MVYVPSRFASTGKAPVVELFLFLLVEEKL